MSRFGANIDIVGAPGGSPARRSIRLQGYDYSQAGAYFVTICTQNRQCLFSEILDGEMRLNDAGLVAQQCWNDIPVHFGNMEMDAFMVMPNHIHGIVVIVDDRARHAVPLRWNDSATRLLVRFQPLHVHSNPPSPNVSMKYANPPVRNYGNATTGNTSSAMNRN